MIQTSPGQSLGIRSDQTLGLVAGLQFVVNTGTVDRLKIDISGAWFLGEDGPGLGGQVLTSAGGGHAPTWTNVGGGASAPYGEVVFGNPTSDGITSSSELVFDVPSSTLFVASGLDGNGFSPIQVIA